MRGKKTGGRQRGTLNKSHGLGRKRERVRKQAARTIEQAMPRLQQWLSSDQAWHGDNAPQSARMLDSLMKWILPAYGRLDPHAEQQAEQQAAVERVEPVSAEQVLEALRAVPQAVPSVEAPAAGQTLEAPALEPTLEALPAGIERLDESESMRLQGQGIPLANGDRLLPPRQPQPAVRPNPAALAAGDRPTLEVRPVRETRPLSEFNASGLIQNPPPLDPSLRPMGWLSRT